MTHIITCSTNAPAFMNMDTNVVRVALTKNNIKHEWKIQKKILPKHEIANFASGHFAVRGVFVHHNTHYHTEFTSAYGVLWAKSVSCFQAPVFSTAFYLTAYQHSLLVDMLTG